MPGSSSFAALPIWVVLPMLAFVAAYFLQVACNTTGTDTPSFRKGLIVSVVGGAAGFFTFDGLGYFLMLGTRDLTHLALPQGYGYLDWLKEPMHLKWQVLGLVPVLRYIPVVIAVCLTGVMYMFLLRETWRIVVVILLFQWVLTVIVSTVMAYALTNILGVVKPPDQAPAGTQPRPTAPAPYDPAQRAQTRPTQRRQAAKKAQAPEAPPERPEAPAGLSAEGGTKASIQDILRGHNPLAGAEFTRWGHEVLDTFQEWANPIVQPIDEAAKPFTQHLPPVVQEFLEDGGWLLVLLGVSVTGVLGVRSIYRRFNRAVSRKQKRRKKAMKQVEIDLEEIGDALNEPGKNQVTVRGFPGRLRLVVMAPGASYVGDLLPEMAESLLDWIQPGLGAIYENDTPRVVVWPRFASEGRFLELVQKSVKIPEERGRKTPWMVTAGTTSLGRQRIYLCAVTHLNKPGYMREVRVAQDKWGEMLGVAPTPE
jgi:predicted lipid-binding transport protein (Tim44 family)